jgi:hypothetical protein
MEHKAVEYTVVQMADRTGRQWKVQFGGGKNRSGVTQLRQAAAIKLAGHEIDRVKDK